MKKGSVLLSLLVASFGLFAQSEKATVLKSLERLGIQGADIRPSPVTGLHIAFTDKGVLYVTSDGKYIVHGTMYDVTTPVPLNITNQFLMQRVEQLTDQMIIYPAAKEKFVVTVFTDISCGYCRKLHSQIKEYNDLGITIRYLAFPREGTNGQAEKEMQSLWCMADRRKAFDAAINGEKISPATCKTNIQAQYELGLQFGIQGTPAVMYSDGTLIPGYQDPKTMLGMLEEHKKMLTANQPKKPL